jgi:hypothetical protein
MGGEVEREAREHPERRAVLRAGARIQGALLIDYVVTVAVQAAAGTVAVVSALRPLGPYSLEITGEVVVIMCYANLRGLRRAHDQPVTLVDRYRSDDVFRIVNREAPEDLADDAGHYHEAHHDGEEVGG